MSDSKKIESDELPKIIKLAITDDIVTKTQEEAINLVKDVFESGQHVIILSIKK